MSDKTLPIAVNDRRRRNLFRYTALAMLSYQLPVGIAYLAKFFTLATYSYSPINRCYLSYMSCSITALTLIRLKNQITKPFIYFTLHMQVVVCMLISAYMIYAMGDQRYLVPIGCLTLLMFVFIQSSLFVSFIAILFVVILYLLPSYIGIVYGGQPGSLLGEILYILMFVPVCIFIAYMAKKMQDQQKKIKHANSILKTTHSELADTYSKLEATHTELEETHAELEIHNEKMTDSIRYAEMIQRSLLPGMERIKAVSTDSMFIWIPKDIVGGDIFYTYADPEGSIVAMMDCTGHGVPGAFLTMIVYSEIRKIIMDEACRVPSEILSRLNKAVKNVLHTNNNDTKADDGLDAAICLIDYTHKTVTYSGARIPLFYIKNGIVHRENGDKQSIGYKDSKDDFQFTNHTIEVDCGCSFYLKTDGYTDQLGGEKNLRFGTDRFIKMILKNHDTSYADQRTQFLQTLITYRGEKEQMDDITLIGFRL